MCKDLLARYYQRLQKKAPEEEKIKKRAYGRKPYQNLPEHKKQKLVE